MLTLELSSYLLEIPNDAYTTLSQFWLAVQHSVKSTGSWWFILLRRQLWTLTCPIIDITTPSFQVLDYAINNGQFQHQSWSDTSSALAFDPAQDVLGYVEPQSNDVDSPKLRDQPGQHVEKKRRSFTDLIFTRLKGGTCLSLTKQVCWLKLSEAHQFSNIVVLFNIVDYEEYPAFLP